MSFVSEVSISSMQMWKIDIFFAEGSVVKKGDYHCAQSQEGLKPSCWRRVALNILQHLSGIASTAGAFVEKVRGLPVRIVDTREDKARDAGHGKNMQ